MPFLDPLEKTLLEYLNSIWQVVADNYHKWIEALVVAVVAFVVLRIARVIIQHYTGRLAKSEKGGWFRDVDCAARRTKTWIMLLVALCLGSLSLEVMPPVVIGRIAVSLLLVQTALWTNALISSAVNRYAERRKETDAAGATTLSALGFVGRMAVWATGALLIVTNLGYDVTTMVAGLGIGGIAVALAAQNILGDLFASASIVLDKPFVLGDFIIVDDKSGNVEHIGLKTTRLRSLSGEQLVFSNADLLKSRIHNYKRMYQRRVVFAIDATYDTPYEKVEAVPAMLREAVESQQRVRFDRAHFARFSESALTFEVVYYVLAPEYGVYMDIQQAINLAILRRFTDEKIEFAFPSRTVYQG
ncbi:MAG: mechanosensitive ion channel family protein [Pirellulales bacterium]|nr:mechanosensitive ion channel family protein [Pirellulales bacterium]